MEMGLVPHRSHVSVKQHFYSGKLVSLSTSTYLIIAGSSRFDRCQVLEHDEQWQSVHCRIFRHHGNHLVCVFAAKDI